MERLQNPWMKRFLLTAAGSVAMVVCGCAGHKPVAARTPQAPSPVPAAAQTPPEPSAAAAADVSAKSEPGAKPRTDAEVIAAAKTAYDQGVALYQQGEYRPARAKFDAAVEAFLTSGHDLSKDQPLDDAFEDTVDKINALELDALQQSNGFSQQEEAPVDVANGVTFPVDPNLLAKARAQLKFTQSDLPLVVNDYVASFINYFTNTRKGHNTIANSLIREGRYRSIVEKTLAQEGVPKDLIYLAVAESGFRPRAINARSGAGGMWQFMPYGDYGLIRNQWVDERFDPELSTRAYARYIKELHQQFGDWYLAMAAYDWGPGKVQRAVQRTGYADFWELYQRDVLPAETKNYVPIILAAAIMAKNPTQYGLADLSADPPLITDTVTTHSAINLNLVADLAGTTLDEIQQLNPALLRLSTPAGMDYKLRLPPGTADLFRQRLAAIPEEHRNSWRYHILAPGETLDSVAESFHVKPSEVLAVNQLTSASQAAAGQALVLPVPPPRLVHTNMRYRTRRGDTLVTLADRFGVTTAQLRRWNHLRSNHVPAGRILYVSEPVYHHRARAHSTHSTHSSRARSHHGTSTSRAAASHKKTEAHSVVHASSKKKHKHSASHS
jgi:membrane-bound lytic murein transglycosylase D